MYLLDTTHCIRFLYSDPPVLNKIRSLDKTDISINVIAGGEMLYGIYKSSFFEINMKRLVEFFDSIKIYPINNETSDFYARLKIGIIRSFGPQDKRKLRNTTTESLGFKENDLWIAASAIQHDLILVSGDSHIWRLNGIEGLKVEHW